MAIYPAKGELDRISSAGRVRGKEEANFGSANGRCGCCEPYFLLHHLLGVWHCCSFHGNLRADRSNLGRDHGSRGTADDFQHHFLRVCGNRDFVHELPLLEEDICRPVPIQHFDPCLRGDGQGDLKGLERGSRPPINGVT